MATEQGKNKIIDLFLKAEYDLLSQMTYLTEQQLKMKIILKALSSN